MTKKRFIQTALLGLIFTLLLSSITFASPKIAPDIIHLTGYVEYLNIGGDGFYGIIGDNGVKYQPTNLPHKLRKHGLPITFDAIIKNDQINSLMWGTIIQLSHAQELQTSISNEERSAIFLLLERLNAFNTKNLAKLQAVDNVAKDLTTEQFESWIANYSNYTLRYVKIVSSDSHSITGVCYYTRELIKQMTLDGNVQLAAMSFRLSLAPTGWKLIDSGRYINKQLFAADPLTAIQKQALLKYKTDNLATLW